MLSKNTQNHRQIALPLLVTLALSLSSCAGTASKYKSATNEEIKAEIRLQKEMAFQRKNEEERRLENISFQILKANAPLCKEVAKDYGVGFHNINDFKKEEKEIAENLYGLNHVFQVFQVNSNSNASKAGVRLGDKVIAINDIDVSTKKIKSKDFYKALNNTKEKPVNVLFLRGHEEIITYIEPHLLCNYGLVYDHKSMEINAYADGKNIVFTRGFYRFADKDEELAIAIGHEIGHNVMKHNQKSKANTDIGLAAYYAIDKALKTAGYKLPNEAKYIVKKGASNVNSVDFEREADYIGLYFAERAGYNTANSIDFWRRMAVEHDASYIDKRSSHPATSERFIYLQKTLEEIEEKRSSGAALEPEVNWSELTRWYKKKKSMPPDDKADTEPE